MPLVPMALRIGGEDLSLESRDEKHECHGLYPSRFVPNLIRSSCLGRYIPISRTIDHNLWLDDDGT